MPQLSLNKIDNKTKMLLAELQLARAFGRVMEAEAIEAELMYMDDLYVRYADEQGLEIPDDDLPNAELASVQRAASIAHGWRLLAITAILAPIVFKLMGVL